MTEKKSTNGSKKKGESYKADLKTLSDLADLMRSKGIEHLKIEGVELKIFQNFMTPSNLKSEKIISQEEKDLKQFLELQSRVNHYENGGL